MHRQQRKKKSVSHLYLFIYLFSCLFVLMDLLGFGLNGNSEIEFNELVWGGGGGGQAQA